MSSPLENAVIHLQIFNYASFIILTAVGYDYILTFSDEIEYIWRKRWTWVSTLFILARYSGLCSVVLQATWWNSTVPLSTKGHFQGNLIYVVEIWCFWTFLCSADLVMILRLWALYSRSRIILGTLLTFYAVEVIGFFINYVLSTSKIPHDPIIGAAQVLGSSTCVVMKRVSHVLDVLQTIAQLALGSWMCLLVVIQFIKESIQMYKVTRRCQLSHYQKLLIWEGLVYFMVILVFAIICQLAITGKLPTGMWQLILCAAIQRSLLFMLFPRFVLGLRKLYARDIGGRRGDALDSAFGLPTSETFEIAVQSAEQEDGMELEYRRPVARKTMSEV